MASFPRACITSYASERSPTMETKKPDEATPVAADSVNAGEAGPSRRELLVQGSKVAAGIGVAALLGNLGNWALSYAAGKEPIKFGVLHSLSGTMAISEVSLRDTVLMAVEEINAKGGVMGRMIETVVVDPASNWDLFAEKAKQLLLQDKVAVVFGCWTSVSRKSVLPVFEKIKKFAAGGGACVISTINGDSNVPFYKEFANQGLRAEDAPIMAFSVAEDELRGMDTSALVGHLAAWNYYQSVDTPQNKQFVANFKAYCKRNNLPDGDKRVTDDPIEAAYFGVYIVKQATEKAGSIEVEKVRKAVYGSKFLAPGGEIMMDPANHHTYRPVLIGEILADGQFKVVSRSKGLVKPEPWSEYTNPDKGCDWVGHQGTYQKKA